MDTGPQNVIAGDNFGTDLPQTERPVDDLAVEKNMAKFSKSREFKKLKDAIDTKIKFYRAYLPDGRPLATVTNKSPEELALDWKVANIVIGELEEILTAYELAREAVKNDTRGN